MVFRLYSPPRIRQASNRINKLAYERNLDTVEVCSSSLHRPTILLQIIFQYAFRLIVGEENLAAVKQKKRTPFGVLFSSPNVVKSSCDGGGHKPEGREAHNPSMPMWKVPEWFRCLDPW